MQTSMALLLLSKLRHHSHLLLFSAFFFFFCCAAETACPNSTRFTPRIVPFEDAQLKVLVPNISRQSFRQLVNCSDPSNVRGFVIDVFETALSSLPDNLSFTTLNYTCFNFSLVPNSTNQTYNYDDMVRAVANGKYNVVVGDVTITSQRAYNVAFTQQYLNSGVVIITKITNSDTGSEWLLFMQPFSWRLWGMIAGAFGFIAVVLWYVEYRRHSQEVHDQGLVWFIRFIMESMVLLERESIKNTAGEFSMGTWVFVVLFLAAIYTAGLSSILTANNLSPDIVDILSLRDSNSIIAYRRGSITQKWLTARFRIPERQLRVIRANSDFIDNITKGPLAGGVIAIVDELPYATMLLANLSCDYGIASPLLTSEGFGIGFNRDIQPSNWVKEVSTAFLNLRESGCLQEMKQNYKLIVADKCSSNGSQHKKISFRSLCPLVMALSTVAIIQVMWSFGRRLKHQNTRVREVEITKITEEEVPILHEYNHWENILK